MVEPGLPFHCPATRGYTPNAQPATGFVQKNLSFRRASQARQEESAARAGGDLTLLGAPFLASFARSGALFRARKNPALLLPPPPHRLPQNLPRLPILLILRPLLPAHRIKLQPLQPLHHPHRKHIPGPLRPGVSHQRINILGAIRPLRMIVRPKAVSPILARYVRRLHLHPPEIKTPPRVQNIVITLAVSPRLSHHKPQLHSPGNKLRLRNLPQLLRSKPHRWCRAGAPARCL